MKNIKQYYKELGKLVYAIALADGIIQEEERHELHHFVLTQLAHYEKTYDSSGMNKAFYVDFEFEEAIKRHMISDDAIKSYTKFMESHFEDGDQKLIERSMKLLESVANAYTKRAEKNILNTIKHITSTIADTNQK
jgi:DNA-directed RNA polymerase sigma subunit (sigma70/sigma32)